ncbi:MAG: archaetidylserine decarboxylase, partial [Natronospirillum sp.]
MFATVFVLLQYILPHHGISRLVGRLAASERRWLSQVFIRLFAHRYKVNMGEAQQSDLAQYRSFNEFFTRALRPEVRPLADTEHLSDGVLICPVDGAVSQAGTIAQEQIFQAKGHECSAAELLGRSEVTTTEYASGHFATLYLSPRDYHRIHMPCDGTLRKMTFVPGRLFSVNPTTAARVPRLFARNERLVCEFDTAQGPMAVVLVGAMIV